MKVKQVLLYITALLIVASTTTYGQTPPKTGFTVTLKEALKRSITTVLRPLRPFKQEADSLVKAVSPKVRTGLNSSGTH